MFLVNPLPSMKYQVLISSLNFSENNKKSMYKCPLLQS